MLVSVVVAVMASAQGPSAPTSLDPAEMLSSFLQYGPLGIVLICLLFRKYLVPEWTLKAAEERARLEKDDLAKRLSEAQEQLDRLQDVFQDQLIPALTRATEVNARYNDELQRARYNRRREDPPTGPNDRIE